MKKKTLALLAFLVFMLIGSLVVGNWEKPAAAEKVYTWKCESFLPESEPEHGVSFARFSKMVEENTKGRVKINLYSAGAIVKVPELMSATRDGVLEMSVWSCGYGTGAIPILGVIDGLPMSWRESTEAAVILYDLGLSELSRKAYADYGVHLLGHHVQSACGLGMLARKPIRTLNDLKGLKVRTHGYFVDFWGKLGASTVTMPLADLYMALATKTVDACTLDWWSQGKVFKTAEIVKNGVLPSQIGCTVGHMIVNPKVWSSLPPDLQTIITLTWREWAGWHQRYFHPYLRSSFESSKRELEKDWGVKFITMPEADQAKMSKVAMEIWDQVAAKNPLSAQGVDLIKGYYRKVGRIK